MNKRRNLIGVGLVVFSLVGVLSVYARPGFGPGRHHHGHGGGFPFGVLKQLDLTNDQQTQIESILKAHRDATAPMRKDMFALQSSITTKLLGTDDNPDFTKESGDATQLHSQLFASRISVGLEIRKILTPDQRAKAAQLITEKQAQMAQRMQEWEQNQ
jgi:Spy/CpxP family protein refolding chaperone